MASRNPYDCAVVTVKDKTTASHTSGSVTTRKEGRNVSVSNNVSTTIVHSVIVEFDDGEQIPLHIENQDFHVPVNQKTLIAFKRGSPVAYQPTKTGKPYTLNYLRTGSSWFDFQGFIAALIMLCLPVFGTLMQFGVLVKDLEFYQGGKMVQFNEAKIAALIALIISPIGFVMAKGFLGYVVACALGGFAVAIANARHERVEFLGKKDMLTDIVKDFEEFKPQLA